MRGWANVAHFCKLGGETTHPLLLCGAGNSPLVEAGGQMVPGRCMQDAAESHVEKCAAEKLGHTCFGCFIDKSSEGWLSGSGF